MPHFIAVQFLLALIHSHLQAPDGSSVVEFLQSSSVVLLSAGLKFELHSLYAQELSDLRSLSREEGDLMGEYLKWLIDASP